MRVFEEIDVTGNDQVHFLQKRVERAGRLQFQLDRVLGNCLVALLTKEAGNVSPDDVRGKK